MKHTRIIGRRAAASLIALTVLGGLPAALAGGMDHNHAAPAAEQSVAEQSVIEINNAWARDSLGRTATGAAYLTVHNYGDVDDTIIGASSPAAARVELHTHIKDGDVMRMRQVEEVELPAGGDITFEPGGLHLMFFDLTAPFEPGDSFPLTIEFAQSGPKEVTVTVQPLSATESPSAGGHDPHAHH